MSHITLITGSTLGGAEYVADHLADLLEQDGHQTEIVNQADLATLSTDQIWLVICSTHGAGDYPDNFVHFAEQLASDQPDLSALRYGIIGLGDSSYDTFCAAAKNIDQQLATLGASRLGERLEIDVSQDPVPEDPAEEWLTTWKTHLNA
ncbi:MULTISPECIES: FMN-binding protein MioC [Photobacterium]|uniref:FMN-binding protein MioC n=1 Tax=Photobacterium ganghwense TaxID=320778 RepID=A0A0J1GZV3_9GAMM|nr:MULTISPECIES: FMN-binding protein MioC [Photobacterium]KLV05039.1 FMN-binding protein MioC [Photobacterium ganghwense]MBV1840072.1 FMN-binding protein MioC [Photobacterium ganghwense]PSU04343.1 FMN-binding protein MioC [Photobacterium ganghwense]QSV14101.1 FMN-binding protein MioC [Photobacterium ganghwense]